MAMSTVPLRVSAREQATVFVGPSLRTADLAEMPDQVSVLPPIRRHDLPEVVDNGARLIGIVDGEFYQSLAVSPKEILAALARGCRIVGGASMGALRAVEMSPWGMRGIGRVFEWYRDGVVHRDDDVAVRYAHDDGEYRLLTVPFVNVKWVAERMRALGMITPASARRLQPAARRIAWETRTWRAVCAKAGLTAHETAAVLDVASRPEEDRKRLDALMTVRAVIAMSEAGERRPA